MGDEWSDEELTARLTRLLAAADAVPPGFVETAKAAYVWHELIDADLADADMSDIEDCPAGALCGGDFAVPVWDAQMVELPLDSGLARLTFDSALADREAPLIRTSATTRALTLIAAELTIELEISKDVLFGQLIPARPGRVRMFTVAGEIASGKIDEVGRFVLRGTPEEPFRLHCRGTDIDVSTTWICP